MKVKVTYLVKQVAKVEITETMIKRLYEEFNNCAFVRSKIMDTVYEYIEQESGYTRNKGTDLNCWTDVESWVDEIVDKLEEEEMFGTEEE